MTVYVTQHRRLTCLLALAGLLVGPPALAQSLQPVRVQMSWKYQYQFAPFIVALEKGYYREAGLEVVLREGGPGINAVDAVVNGAADYGVFSSALVLEYAQGKPVVALAALMQHSPVAVMARRDRGIDSVLDLADREVAVSRDTRDEVHAYLQASGLSGPHIRLVDKAQPGLLALAHYDAISVYSSNEGYFARRDPARYALFSPRSAGIDLFGNILFTSRARLDDHSDEALAFRAATLRGLSYALAHHDEVSALILARYNSQAKPRQHLLYEARTITELTRPDIVEPGYMSPGRWRHVVDVYAGQGQVAADLDLHDFIYDPHPETDVRWLYGVLAVVSLVLLTTAAFLLQARRYNRRLRQSEARFRDLFEKNPDPCWLIENNTFAECNEQAATVLGYSSPEALRHRHPSVVSPQHQPDGRASKEKANEMMALAYAQGVHRFEWEHQRRNGETFPVEVTLARIQQDGRAMLYCVWHDITERKHSEKIKNEFVSTVSHELRTPLTAIRGTLKLVNSGKLDADKSREMLRIAENNSEKLLFLINDLLDMEKLESGNIDLHYAHIPLDGLLQACVEENQSYAQQHQTEIVLESNTGAELMADEQRLKQVMANLLSNACKYSPPGVAVTVRAKVQGMDVRIEVQDHGAGIPANFQDKVFDKFTQADSSSTRRLGGTGLGLSIVKRIVELHGGTVSFTTADKLGTTFHVVLPRLVRPT